MHVPKTKSYSHDASGFIYIMCNIIRCHLAVLFHQKPTIFGSAKRFHVKHKMSSLFSVWEHKRRWYKATHTERARTTKIDIVQCKESWYCSLFPGLLTKKKHNNHNHYFLVDVLQLPKLNIALSYALYSSGNALGYQVIWDNAHSAPIPISVRFFLPLHYNWILRQTIHRWHRFKYRFRCLMIDSIYWQRFVNICRKNV